MKPILASAASTAATDEQLVAATREGSDEAVEALFRRYRERITAYARGIVVDPGRAEDIVQETFISALRSLRATDREVVFRPWIYQIAKNACIDQLRRQKRAEEISIDSDDFKPHYEGRLSQSAPTTHGAASQREDMDVLTQAFGGLPRSQHEILVLRELEGRSYDEIARRLDLSTSAVESMLFRARRGLKDEYEEISTGERCRRTQTLIAAVAEGMGAARDRRAISRHAQLCTTCRQQAVTMGLGALVTARDRRGRVRSALNRAAAFLPLPPFFRRGGNAGEASSAGLGGRAQSILSNFGSLAAPGAEQATLLPKAVAVLAAAALIGGGGVVGQNSAGGSEPPATPPSGGVLGSPGAPGQPPLGSATVAGTSGSPNSAAAGLLGGSEQSSSVLSSPSALSPSLLPPSMGGGGGGSQGAGSLGGLPAAGGVAGPVIAPGSGLRLPSANGIRVPGASDGGRGLPSVGGVTVPQLQQPSVPKGVQLPSVGSPRLPDRPSLPVPSPKPPNVSKPSLPPVKPSVPSVPSAPSAPALPSTPSVPAVPALDSVTGTVGSVAGPTGPSLPLP